MANEYRIPGYKVAGYKVAHIDMASRAEVETYFRNMTQPTLSVNSQTKLAQLVFPQMPERIANAIFYKKYVRFGVVRHIAAGNHHTMETNSIGNPSSGYSDRARQRERGYNSSG